MTEEQRSQERRKRRRMLVSLDLVREFTERPSVRQIVRYPYIHALVLATVWSAALLLLTIGIEEGGLRFSDGKTGRTVLPGDGPAGALRAR